MAERRPDRAADIAYHYHRSAAMSGAEAGVAPALAAAEVAEAAYAHDDVATFLRMALDLMPAGDVRRPRLLARLGLALTWALRFEEAVQAAGEAGDTIARTEGADAAADYLAAAAMGMNGLTGAGYWRGAWALAAQGLRYAGERRDATWVALNSLDILRAQVEDPDFPGHFLDTPERREVARVVERLPPIGEDDLQVLIFWQDFASRAEVLARARNSHWMFYAAGISVRASDSSRSTLRRPSARDGWPRRSSRWRTSPGVTTRWATSRRRVRPTNGPPPSRRGSPDRSPSSCS